MEFRLLGPIEVAQDGMPVQIAAGKQRALLALLLLNANRTLSGDQLVDALWGDEVPDSARKMLQIYVSHLRKALPERRLHTTGAGYMLEAAEDELDLRRFERALDEARDALSQNDAGRAKTVLDGALALWRGPALAELTEPFARHESARLEELRVVALEWQVEAALALGRHDAAVGQLETLVARHPLRERLRSQHMLALYRSGRQAEALASYQAFRRTLADDLGIEPSPSLRELERQMLQQEPILEPTTGARPAAVAAERETGTPGAPSGEAVIAYARSGDTRIAYQVVGDGPVDLVLVHGWVCTFQPGWENPKLARFYRRLASMGRLILFDKRGTGLSDRVSPERLPDLETRMDDVRAVLDALGSERAIVLGISEGGPMSALFAATHPERVTALVLMGSFARMMWAPDYPIGLREDVVRKRIEAIDEDDWVTAVAAEWLGRVAPDALRDPGSFQWYASYVRRGASPAATKAIRLMNAEIDIRAVLPSIGVPALVVYRADEYFSAGTRYLGEHIPGARALALPGKDHLPWEGDSDRVLDEIELFVSGLHDSVDRDRVLATLLFTDIVGSTGRAAELGDRAWSELLTRYRGLVRAEIERFRGREVDSTGDEVFAVFDGPARAVRCAQSIASAVRSLGLQVRAGVHTGEVEQTAGSVRGIAVHIGSRIAATSDPDEVLVSSTVRDIVAGSGLVFVERGEHELGGVPGTWRLYAASA